MRQCGPCAPPAGSRCWPERLPRHPRSARALQADGDQPGLLFVDGHEDAWPPSASPTGEAADCELGLALRLFVLPAPWWLHVDLDVLATSDFAAVDYPQTGGLTWEQLGQAASRVRRDTSEPRILRI